MKAKDSSSNLIDRLEDMLETSTGSTDEKISLQIKDDGIYLIVAPFSEGATPSFAAVKRLLDTKEIVDYNTMTIRQALEEQTGEPVLIAPRKPELDRDAEVKVVVEDNGFTAYLEVKPALGGAPLTKKMIMEALESAGVKEGIKSEVIEKILTSKFGGRYLIAEGQQPVNGVDASLSFKFDIDPDAAPVELADGSVDFRNLNLIQNVNAGEVLVERIPPVPGLPGVNVYGKQIKPEGGKTIRLPKGANTAIDEENEDLLLAKASGQAVYKDGKVHVYPVYTVPGDVDFQTGNIDFVGSIVVQGSVRSGFSIHASGNVEIRGPVEAATIVADGDVVLHYGMQGSGTGQIIAGKSVNAKFFENSMVRAKEDIVVTDAVMYSQLEAGQKIQIVGRQGRLVGGEAIAGTEIQVRTVGSKLGMKTEIEVGANPEVRKELNELCEELKQKEQQFKMVTNGLTRIKQEVDSGKILSNVDNSRLTKLVETHQLLSDQIASMERRKAELEELIALGKHGRILVHDRIYPGVKVTIGKESTVIQDEIQNVSFYLRDNELAQGSAV